MKTLFYNSKRYFKASTFIILNVVLGINSAQSADKGEFDAKYYPGSICRDATSFSNRDMAVYTDLGYVANNQGDKQLSVVCPLMRDNVGTTGGISSMTIYYTDNHASQDIECRAISRKLNGDLFDYSDQKKSSGKGAGRILMYNVVNTDYVNSFLYVSCKIPERARDGRVSLIKTIIINESK